MKNRATVFSVNSRRIVPGPFAIVAAPPQSADSLMPGETENPLQEFVLRVMKEEKLSFADVEKAAREKRGTLSRSTVQQIAKGETTNPGVFTLVELAWGLNRSVEEVILIALSDHMEDVSAFEKSELARIDEMSRGLPPAEQRIYKRYVQMLGRKVQRLLGGN